MPTRTLIQQVQLDLEEHFAVQGPVAVKVSCLPLTTQVNDKGPTMFVLTQERLHVLLNNLPQNFVIDLLVVDEAQKVGNSARGDLLQIVFEAVAVLSVKVKVIFASPTTSNPEVLLDGAPPAARRRGFRSNQVTVNPNLIWMSPVVNTEHTWSAGLCFADERIPLGNIDLPFRPLTTLKRLAFAAFAMGNTSQIEDGNLIYANGAADAEEIALLIHDLIGPSVDLKTSPAIADLIALSKRSIREEYRLTAVAKQIERIAETIDSELVPAEVQAMYVFGSYARGALEPDDLDLIIVHDPPSLEVLDQLQMEINKRHGQHLHWSRELSARHRFETNLCKSLRKPGEKINIRLTSTADGVAGLGRNRSAAVKVLVWSKDERGWRKNLATITPDSTASRFE